MYKHAHHKIGKKITAGRPYFKTAMPITNSSVVYRDRAIAHLDGSTTYYVNGHPVSFAYYIVRQVTHLPCPAASSYSKSA